MKVLMVLAHPDDEIIFGWPILQDDNIEKEILICSSDENNPERLWCAHRKQILYKLCQKLNITCQCLNYNSEFYRTETRKESFKRLCSDILFNISKSDYDYIFTHNPVGEYGHLDHVLINNIVMNTNSNIIISDMFLSSNWIPYTTISEKYKKLYYNNKLSDNVLDLNFYNYYKSLYTKEKIWTWCFDPIDKCSLYII